MSHVFIDGGGNWRRIVDRYLKLAQFDKVYVFEPNPVFYESYEDSDFILVKKAIWIEDCEKQFFISTDENQVASSLLEEKLSKPHFTQKWGEPIEVECVDFSKWLVNHISSDDTLTLKLDIEGAEYEVLSKMIVDGTIEMVDTLYVEFHSDTLPEKKEAEEKLILALRDCGIDPQEWD